ncbi:MAG TPA: glycosyltransferase [Bryobacteraceae bacterium]|nr:glycosyltransferase [Bryobacteraceae bacterium]
MNKLEIQEAPPISADRRAPAARVAYIVSGFPTLYETFVLYDMQVMEELGVAVDLYPLRRMYPRISHPEAQRWEDRAHFHPYLSWEILRAQSRAIRSNARGYFKLWAEVLRGTWGSANYFLGAMAIFPKAVLFAEKMSRDGVAHVHAHFANHPAVAALVIHRLTGIPFSFTARGSDVLLDQHMLKRKVDAAEFSVAVSSDLKRVMVSASGSAARDKIHVIRGGVDVERLSPKSNRRPGGALRILCVARFEEVKGHAYLVEACRILRQRGVPFQCRLIGEGPLAQSIELQVKSADLAKEVQFLGPRSYQEVINELAAADVLVLPTAPTAAGDREGMPTVLQEAMACGLPVVSSLVEGIAELVDDDLTGILVLPRNSTALAEALQRLNGDANLRQRMGRAGREKVAKKFSLKANTAKRAALFLKNSSPEEFASGLRAEPRHGLNP